MVHFDKKLRVTMEAFLIDNVETMKDLSPIIQSKDMTPGQKLHFIEKICEMLCPWVLLYFDVFWALLDLPKYVDTPEGPKYIFDVYPSSHGIRSDRNILFSQITGELEEEKEYWIKRRRQDN